MKNENNEIIGYSITRKAIVFRLETGYPFDYFTPNILFTEDQNILYVPIFEGKIKTWRLYKNGATDFREYGVPGCPRMLIKNENPNELGMICEDESFYSLNILTRKFKNIIASENLKHISGVYMSGDTNVCILTSKLSNLIEVYISK